MNRQQRVKIGSSNSQWLQIWGTVPQGTLLGILLFIAIINDLKTDCHTVKYVDDTMLSHVLNHTKDNALQSSVTVATD